MLTERHAHRLADALNNRLETPHPATKAYVRPDDEELLDSSRYDAIDELEGVPAASRQGYAIIGAVVPASGATDADAQSGWRRIRRKRHRSLAAQTRRIACTHHRYRITSARYSTPRPLCQGRRERRGSRSLSSVEASRGNRGATVGCTLYGRRYSLLGTSSRHATSFGSRQRDRCARSRLDFRCSKEVQASATPSKHSKS